MVLYTQTTILFSSIYLRTACFNDALPKLDTEYYLPINWLRRLEGRCVLTYIQSF